MDQTFAQILFVGLIAWLFYMATFRHRQLIEINEHMKVNARWTSRGAAKAANMGLKAFGAHRKK